MKASLRFFSLIALIGLVLGSGFFIVTPIDVAATTAIKCSALSKQYTFDAHGYSSFQVPTWAPQGAERDALTAKISANIDAGISEAKTKCKQKMDQQQAGFFLDCVNYCTQQHVCDATYNSLGDTECQPKGATDPHLPPYMTITGGGTYWNYNFMSSGSGTSSCNCKDKVKTADACVGPENSDCTVIINTNQGGSP